MKKLILANLMAALLASCASTVSQYEGITFLRAPEDISSAWKSSDGDVYIVLEKGVIVDHVLGQNGDSIAWTTAGAYLVLPAETLNAQESGRVWLMIEGKQRMLDANTTARK